MASKYTCGTLGEFEESIKRMREIDDKILYALYTAKRENAKQSNEVTEVETYCIQKQEDFLAKLEEKVEKNKSDVSAIKLFNMALQKLRSFETVRLMDSHATGRSVENFNKMCGSFITGNIPPSH